MRLFLISIVIILYGCSENRNETNISDQSLSYAQKTLQDLADSLKSDYRNQKTQALKDSTIAKYQNRLYNFLSENYIDSIKVRIDSVNVKGWTVMIKSHCNKDISFQYSLTFIKEMNKNADSVFQFAKNLKMGSDTTVNFSYMGSHAINDPYNTELPVFIIYAFPAPIFLSKK